MNNVKVVWTDCCFRWYR